MREAIRVSVLSPRQAEVGRLLAFGASYEEVGRELGIKVSTVRTHVHAIYGRLGIRSPAELTYALQKVGILLFPRPVAEPGLAPAWKAYLREFDRHLLERTRASRARMRTMFKAAMIGEGRALPARDARTPNESARLLADVIVS